MRKDDKSAMLHVQNYLFQYNFVFNIHLLDGKASYFFTLGFIWSWAILSMFIFGVCFQFLICRTFQLFYNCISSFG